MGHTPSTAGTFRRKFRKNSGKTPETLSERFLEFPSRVRLGCPKPYNSRHLRLPEHFQNSLPPSTAGDASFFGSGSGEGLSEPVMEFPAVLGVFPNNLKQDGFGHFASKPGDLHSQKWGCGLTTDLTFQGPGLAPFVSFFFYNIDVLLGGPSDGTDIQLSRQKGFIRVLAEIHYHNSCLYLSFFRRVSLVFEVFQDTWHTNKENPSVYWHATLSCPLIGRIMQICISF